MSRRYQAAILTASYNGLQVPNAPTIGTATAGAGSASVTFTAPANVGGGAITSYTVISSPGSIIGTGASSPITVSGLTNDTAYTFTVVATNAYGSGPASAASNSVTPMANYIEAVFSTWLYTGNGTTQTITNGINLATKGGMVWQKDRTTAGTDGVVCDTARGVNAFLRTSGTYASVNNGGTDAVYAYNSNGFSTGTTNGFNINLSGDANVSWTFAKQPKFFDVVTYTGTGSTQNIAHSLGSTPGFIIVKSTSNVGGWYCYHRSLGATQYIVLNSTNALDAASSVWNNTAPTSSVFTVGSFSEVNGSGQTFVAYVYAHNAGGFGASGTDNVISCGSYTGSASNVDINLGYEAQWVLVKNIGRDATNWQMLDIMRGMPLTGSARTLAPNLSNAESSPTAPVIVPTATGMTITGGLGFSINYDGDSYIYIAIRRGPMATPTVGTTVYQANTYTGNATANTTVAGSFGFPVDLLSLSSRDATAQNFSLYGQYMIDRLQGQNVSLGTATTTANTTNWNTYNAFNVENSIGWGLYGSNSGTNYMNNSGGTFVARGFKRAPGFFDEVCYTGTGSPYSPVAHNLTVVPQMIIGKFRNSSSQFYIYHEALGTTSEIYFNTNAVNTPVTPWTLTSTTFQYDTLQLSGITYATYLFATLAGVSKVGSYTGTGALQTVNCGFTTGARFILIKRSDSTGDWYVWDSVRGITGGNDPYLLMNSTAAEVTNTNYVDTTGVGFQVTAAAPAGLNAVGGTYIFLAIA